MKLFEFWTELPASILSMFPELSDELNQFSQMISQWSKKILIAQELVIGQLNKIQINDLSSEALDSLQNKLQAIEGEKANLAVQGIKATTRVLSEASKYLESLDFPSKDNMTQLKLTLKITRTIKDKILFEQTELKLNKENCPNTSTKNTGFNTYSSQKDNDYSVNPNNTQVTLSNSTDIDCFLEMLSTFVDKIQSKLFFKSNQLISSLAKCSISGFSNINQNENETSQSCFSPNMLSHKLTSLSDSIEKESAFEANRNYLVNIKQNDKKNSTSTFVSRKRTLSCLSEKRINEVDSLRKEKRKNKSKIVLKKNGKKTSIFSYRTTCSSDSTSDNNSRNDLVKSHSEDSIQITNFRAD